MNNRKPRRKILSVDMTAMCDVAFIILIFFVVSAKAKAWLPVSIDEPVATKPICAFGDDNNATVLVSINKVMFQIPQEIRKQALIEMGRRYNIVFTDEELSKFEKIETIGVPISQLKGFIDNDYNNWNNFFLNQPGIPVNSGNYELANWIDIASKAEKVTKDRDLDFMLDADKRNLYPQIERITDILTSQRIYKFSLEYIAKSKV